MRARLDKGQTTNGSETLGRLRHVFDLKWPGIGARAELPAFEETCRIRLLRCKAHRNPGTLKAE